MFLEFLKLAYPKHIFERKQQCPVSSTWQSGGLFSMARCNGKMQNASYGFVQLFTGYEREMNY